MIFDIYKLRFQTPLHISKGKINSYESSDATLHSDTIKSALFVCIIQLFDEATAVSFMQIVRVSSAFPFVEENCWLPKPLSFYFKDTTVENRKKFKDVNFFTSNQYAQILQGNQPILEYRKDKPVQPEIWESDVTQRVKINFDADSDPFYLEKLYPKNENAGLYFIFQLHGFDENKLDAAMKLLGDNGFGLQRTLGNGQFTSEKNSFGMALPDSQNAWVSLSLYRPKNKEEIANNLAKSSYQFIKRGGWIASPANESFTSLRKKSIMMFIEGSVFSFNEEKSKILTKENIEDIRPDWNDENLHEIYRDGSGIFLPLKINAGE